MAQAQADLARFKHDVDYYEAHREELLAKHPDTWVAIFNRAVVGAAPQLEDLLAVLEERGVPAAQALVKHVTKEDDLLILHL